ncbi:VCBS domain-containing protein, partial [Azonexus caeni]|uniref:VCBS domain-containing protein n=1 Tax=Azonexus caeni TaxID=266126 RepID=UPI003A88763F
TTTGDWTYTVANADVQYLGEGETKIETFTVKTVDGTTHDVVITITGTNDGAEVSGKDKGAVTEDASNPNLTDTGTLLVTDVDGLDEAQFQTTGIVASAGALGGLTITATGDWTYTVANADVQYLGEGETKIETFTVKTVDGTTHDIVVTITGTNDGAEVSGKDKGAVTEDASNPNLTDTGTLLVTDVDGLDEAQ